MGLTPLSPRVSAVELGTLGKWQKYLTGLAGLSPAYSENKPIKDGDYGFKPY